MPAKLFRSVLPGEPRELPRIDTSVAHVARVYDYWLGGKDNFAIDREVGQQALQAQRDRAVGAGQPAVPGPLGALPGGRGGHPPVPRRGDRAAVGEQHPRGRAGGRARRAGGVRRQRPDRARARPRAADQQPRRAGASLSRQADIKDVDEILAGAAQVLDWGRPVGVMLVAVLHMLRDEEDPQGVVDRLTAAVSRPGGFLVISHLASDVQQEAMAEMGRRLNQAMTQQITMRSHAQVTALLRRADGDGPRRGPGHQHPGGWPEARPAEGHPGKCCSWVAPAAGGE